jgi:hypothetical protein
MRNEPVEGSAFPVRHGASELPLVRVDAYNAELRRSRGFLGDAVSKPGFLDILQSERRRLAKAGCDPFGKSPKLSLSDAEASLGLKRLEQAGLVHGVIERFAAEFVRVIHKFLRLPGWRGTARIVVGGRFRGRRAGELAIGRAAVLLTRNAQ